MVASRLIVLLREPKRNLETDIARSCLTRGVEDLGRDSDGGCSDLAVCSETSVGKGMIPVEGVSGTPGRDKGVFG
jgi:hypothetical protein